MLRTWRTVREKGERAVSLEGGIASRVTFCVRIVYAGQHCAHLHSFIFDLFGHKQMRIGRGPLVRMTSAFPAAQDG